MNPDTSSGIRSFLKIIGGALGTYGAMDAADVATLVNTAEMFFGAAFALWGIVWSIWAKRPKSAEAKQVAAAVIVSEVPIQAQVQAAVANAPVKTQGG